MTDQKLTKAVLSHLISNKFDLPRVSADSILDSIIFSIIEGISQDDELKINGFGTFIANVKRERIGRNPKTGEKATISARKSISFRASKTLKERLNRKKRAAKTKATILNHPRAQITRSSSTADQKSHQPLDRLKFR